MIASAENGGWIGTPFFNRIPIFCIAVHNDLKARRTKHRHTCQLHLFSGDLFLQVSPTKRIEDQALPSGKLT